jgi:hypothetical protein
MDNDQQVQVIEDRLGVLDGMPVSDDRSAREAFTHVMVTVSRISQLSAQVRGQALMGAEAPADEVLERLRTWLERLVSALTRIVANLSGARSFSISAGAVRRADGPGTGYGTRSLSRYASYLFGPGVPERQ